MPTPSRIVYYGRVKPRKPFPKAPLVVIVVVIVIAALGVGLWYLSNLPQIRIQKISVSGSRTLAPEEIQKKVSQAISGTRWYGFPNDNFFLLSSGSLERALEAAFPRVEAVRVNKKFPQGLSIVVTERFFWGIYCQKQEIIGPCVYIDRLGVAYEELDAFSGSLAPVIHAPEAPQLGAAVVSPALRELYERSEEALAGISAKLVSLEIATATPRDLKLALAEGWHLLVPRDSDPQQWVSVFKTVLDQEIGSRRSKLEYVDLRFGSKVFYKYR